MKKQQVVEQAKQTLVSHGLYSVPVDPVVLANRGGIRVVNATFSENGTSGVVARRGKQVLILVEQSDPPYRKRFTIAHELGHHFLHLSSDGEFVDQEVDILREEGTGDLDSPRTSQEVEANQFAAALLMPAELVKREWPKYQSIEGMARRFQVSWQAMGIRIVQLGLA
jgi:Zn-dependent peptidase ImmA (M78 family)